LINDSLTLTKLIKNMLTDTQVFLALFLAMIAGVLAIQLGASLYD